MTLFTVISPLCADGMLHFAQVSTSGCSHRRTLIGWVGVFEWQCLLAQNWPVDTCMPYVVAKLVFAGEM